MNVNAHINVEDIVNAIAHNVNELSSILEFKVRQPIKKICASKIMFDSWTAPHLFNWCFQYWWEFSIHYSLWPTAVFAKWFSCQLFSIYLFTVNTAKNIREYVYAGRIQWIRMWMWMYLAAFSAIFCCGLLYPILKW